ncbi:hypothetical protein K2173_022249 [Erythroxylum novogranatense]|uniref:RNase H type-1 domain-containing protein n=1 Tax=Erythroxylum novogranatense TaxID=1862640 RepID=A0AAV8SUX3_9ROSI|nr:hypothetical protein K2173_022249 [Erythroxylum novogranatense]
MTVTVSTVLSTDFHWDFHVLRTPLPANIRAQIVVVLLSWASCISDRLGLPPDQRSSLSSGYSNISDDCLSVFDSGAHLASHRPPRWIAWTKPPPGFVKLNTDGSAVGNPGRAGYGGLIRDMEGCWIAGFSGSVGIATNILAELQGLKHGLQLTWDLGYRSVLVETDCLAVVNLISDMPQPYHPHLFLIRDIQDLFAKQWRCSLHHVLREAIIVRTSLRRLDRHSCSCGLIGRFRPPGFVCTSKATVNLLSFCGPSFPQPFLFSQKKKL